jgi:hypothetical protein
MDFSLSYNGTEGDLEAALYANGVLVATTSGLKDRKAVTKWADQQARDYKVENTPEATHTHEISGSKTFTL